MIVEAPRVGREQIMTQEGRRDPTTLFNRDSSSEIGLITAPGAKIRA
jgi:hypothetical protein